MGLESCFVVTLFYFEILRGVVVTMRDLQNVALYRNKRVKFATERDSIP